MSPRIPPIIGAVNEVPPAAIDNAYSGVEKSHGAKSDSQNSSACCQTRNPLMPPSEANSEMSGMLRLVPEVKLLLSPTP